MASRIMSTSSASSLTPQPLAYHPPPTHTHMRAHTHTHSMVFWLGDLNYRIQLSPEMTAEQVKAYADNYQLQTLLKFDQLLQEMTKKTVFMGFTEGPITFKPTYKYNVNSDEWDRYMTHGALQHLLHAVKTCVGGRYQIHCSYSSLFPLLPPPSPLPPPLLSSSSPSPSSPSLSSLLIPVRSIEPPHGAIVYSTEATISNRDPTAAILPSKLVITNLSAQSLMPL